jgi:hypothetical protein
MVVSLPDKFLKWNYYPRARFALDLIRGIETADPNRYLLDTTRHNPCFCTVGLGKDGSVSINAKIVGVGYVLKEEFLGDAIRAYREHISFGKELFGDSFPRYGSLEDKEKIKVYQDGALKLMLQHIYFLERGEAERRVDFTKLSTLELAKRNPSSSKHTWKNLQTCRSGCLLFYRPPNLSFEIRGKIDIYESGPYYEFVNAGHDVFHYYPERDRVDRPAIIFNVEEVYDNSVPGGWGRKLA